MEYLPYIVIIFLSACCQQKDLFYIQHTDVTAEELPNSCSHFIEKINTTWLKYGKKPCHHYNVFAQGFAVIGARDRECIIGMDIALIKRLFGKPDEESLGKLVYIFDDKCDEDMNTKPNAVYRKNLIFHYSSTDNKVKEVSLVRGGEKQVY